MTVLPENGMQIRCQIPCCLRTELVLREEESKRHAGHLLLVLQWHFLLGPMPTCWLNPRYKWFGLPCWHTCCSDMCMLPFLESDPTAWLNQPLALTIVFPCGNHQAPNADLGEKKNTFRAQEELQSDFLIISETGWRHQCYTLSTHCLPWGSIWILRLNGYGIALW